MTNGMDAAVDIEKRKRDHIDLCATGDVGFRAKTTLFEEVEFVHDALPELHVDQIDTRVTLFGKTLSAPIIIAAMTGGTEKARGINRELARIADEEGYGFGLGSQRAMLDPTLGRDPTYGVRDVAPRTLVLGNIGGVQARKESTRALADLAARVGADALCVHLNPAMEIVQPGGDRDFEGIVETLARLDADLGIPVVAKETGCGIGPAAARKILRSGVRHVDVSGAGGTSWVAVEMLRAEGDAKQLGTVLRDWGVPTAASVVVTRAARPRFKTIIATGGVASGIDVARALALGADAAGIARPVLQALTERGPEGARAFLAQVKREIASVMLLTGAKTPKDLAKRPLLLGPNLERWSRLAADAFARR
ncbi:MAG: type 2 isopentenyl-diphosphate Delta-isomerase [Polyangiaceae bacterium]